MSAAPVVNLIEPEPEAFDLRALVREVAESAATPDPNVLSELVVEKVPAEFLREALRQTLPRLVRLLLHEQRKANRKRAQEDQATPTPSTRWDGVGSVYLRFLEESVFTGKEWKFRGDFTREDCLAVYELKLEHAKATAVEARREQFLATAMEKADAKVVADLPEVTVLEVLRWQP